MGRLPGSLLLMALIALAAVATPSHSAEVVIGTGTDTWQYPLATAGYGARTQIIYLASEIGGSGRITALSLYVTTVPGQTMNNFTIRMKHTPLSSYSVASWESADWTTVCQVNQSVSGTGWQTFTFTAPFDYNGSDNLMVDISFKNNSHTTSGYCRYSYTGWNRALYSSWYSGNGDPLTWWGTSNPTPSTTIAFPNVKLQLLPIVATPTFSPGGGTYPSPQCVTIGCATAGAVIHYTTDGSTPTCGSTTCTGCVQMDRSMTLQAIACKDGWAPSAVKSADYTLMAATPAFSPDGGTYTSAQCVTVNCATAGAVIHYTTDGSTPTCGSTTYTGCVQVSASMTLKAIACMDGCNPSAAKSADYAIRSPRTVYVKPTGSDSNSGLSWDLAKKTVQAGLNAIVAGDEVWVAGDSANPYVERITLKAGAGLYGGFAGTETSRDQRNWQANVTILDSSGAGDVVTAPSGATATTVLGGFTVRNGGGQYDGVSCLSSSPCIINNTISGNASGIHCDNSSPSITNNTISGNTGIGIACYYSSSPSVTNNTISGNGGTGIICFSASSPSITENAISGNSLAGIGCHISSSPTIANNTITGNTQDGINCSDSCSPSITGNTISENRNYGISSPYASSSPSITHNTISDNDYGGIWCDSSSPQPITGNTISGNGGTGIGFDNSSPSITNNTITGNGYSGIGFGNSSPYIADNTISNNFRGIGCDSYSSGSITNNTISGNTREGIFCGRSYPSITNNTISGNSWYGIYCYDNSSLSITNNVIAGNTQGISTGDSSASITNNTIAGNAYAGITFYFSGCSWVRNNIVAFNATGIDNVDSCMWPENNCVYNPGGTNYSGLDPGAGDISVDPVFVDRSAGNYHLRLSSPCVDAGLNSAVSPGAVDMDGQQRIMPTGGTVDIGADEFDTYSCTVADVKASAPDGRLVILSNTPPAMAPAGRAMQMNAQSVMTTTAKFADQNAFYIERLDRSNGIRCTGTSLLDPGQTGTIQGIMGTVDGERVVTQASVIDGTLATADIPKPLAMNCRATGGGASGLQVGVLGGMGLNNIGLLVRTWGSIVERDTASPATWFEVDDGSGVNVKCLVPSGVTISPLWTYAAVTGISSCEKTGTDLFRLLRVRTQSDIAGY